MRASGPYFQTQSTPPNVAWNQRRISFMKEQQKTGRMQRCFYKDNTESTDVDISNIYLNKGELQA